MMLPLPDCPLNGQPGLGQAREKCLLCFGGNPGRIIYWGDAENDQQHFSEEAPKFFTHRLTHGSKYIN